MKFGLKEGFLIVVVLVLLCGCLLVLLPFLYSLLWAAVLVIASWPAYSRLLRLVGDRHSLAALLMTLGMILILLLPFVIIGATLAENVRDMTVAAQKMIHNGPPAPPEWLDKIPAVGHRLTAYWQSLAADTAKLWAQLQRVLEPAGAWLLRRGLTLGGGLIKLALSIFIAFFLFRNGELAGGWVKGLVRHIADDRGLYLLKVASNTVRGVVYGILGTALSQAVLAGIGFFIAGVPGAALLALLTFFASIVPVVGTALTWGPAAFWLFHNGSTGWAVFMVIWGLAVANLDNVVKPWLISQGSDMPFLLIFFGVIGGALTFGFIGVFLGPTFLAVGYRLVAEWAVTSRIMQPVKVESLASPAREKPASP
jgi:predicted PurR-regulated permease PerM